jgi:hypothetical protein
MSHSRSSCPEVLSLRGNGFDRIIPAPISMEESEANTHTALALHDEVPMASNGAHETQSRAIAPPAVNPVGLDLRCAYLAAMDSGRSESRRQCERPTFSLEALLVRAKTLTRQLPYKDTRGRLLQSALLRRDHALLAAVVESVEKAPFEPVPNAPSSTRRKQLLRARTSPHASERPTRRPPARKAD